MGLWWCTHRRPRSRRTSTILHSGNQCTSDWNQDNSCAYYRAGWTFVSCELAAVERSKTRLKVGKAPKVEKKKKKAKPRKGAKKTAKKTARKTARRR